jgi:hypothetical protein
MAERVIRTIVGACRHRRRTGSGLAALAAATAMLLGAVPAHVAAAQGA